MDAITRKKKLIELISNRSNIAMTGIPLQYREKQELKMYIVFHWII